MALRESIRDFVARECAAHTVNEWENTATYPDDVYRRMADLGYVGLVFPEEHGGSGASVTELCILAEELGRAGYDFSVGLGIRIFCGLNVLHYGTEEQKVTLLPPLISGDLRFSTSITEPGSGSDAASLATRAELRDGRFVVNGQKLFTTAAHVPDTTLQLYCRTDPDAPKHRGISALLVPNDTPGLTVTRLEAMGRNMVGTNLLFLDDLEVPETALLGDINGGWKVLMSSLKAERLYISAAYVGAAQAVIEDALTHAQSREQFGRPIGSFQVIAHMLADMQMKVDAMRLMVAKAAWLESEGRECMREVAEAKLFGSEMFLSIAGDGMQILGGSGYMLESSMQRHFRDARSATITGGTSQIQRTVIARSMGLDA